MGAFSLPVLPFALLGVAALAYLGAAYLWRLLLVALASALNGER